MEEALDNWEDLLNDDAAFDKIVQLKEDGFEDEDIEPDQLDAQQPQVQTGPAKPSEKKLLQKEQKRKMMEKLQTVKKKYEENAFGNMLLPQDKRNLKLQQHLLSQKQDELNIASLVGEQQQEEQLEIPQLQFTLATQDDIKKLITELDERLKLVEVQLLQEMLIRGLNEGLKQLQWSSKETGKMFEKVRAFLVRKEKKERSNKKDKKKQQVHVNLSKAATKKLAIDDEEDDSEQEEVYEVVNSDEEEKKEEEQKENLYKNEISKLKLENCQQTNGFIVRCFEIMKLIADDKQKKEFSVEILVKIAEIACELTQQSKEWKENVMEKIKDIHNSKMNEEKGSNAKKKNPLAVSVNVGKANEIEIAKAVEEEQQQEEFDPDEDFM